MPSTDDRRLSRRAFLRDATLTAAVVSAGWPGRPVAAQPAERARPGAPHGVQSGDVSHHSAVVWSATDRPARMIVEYATTERFADVRRIVGPVALPETGHAAQVVLTERRPARTSSTG